jgi:hypothetical protein
MIQFPKHTTGHLRLILGKVRMTIDMNKITLSSLIMFDD